MDVWNPLEKVKGGGNVPETYIMKRERGQIQCKKTFSNYLIQQKNLKE